MVDVVDSIVAELIIRDVDKYERGFDRATAAHGRFLASTGKLKTQTFDLAAEGQKYKAGADKMAQAQEQSDQRITRSRKKRAADAKATDEAEVASAKRTAKAKADAEIAEAQRSARIRDAVEKGVSNSRVRQGSGANLGRTVPRDGARMAPSSAPSAAAKLATAEVVVAKEVDHLTADLATKQANLNLLHGKDRAIQAEIVAELRLEKQLKAAGLRDDEIALRLEERRALVGKQRARESRSALLGGAGKFGEGAGLGRTGGSGAAIAGIAAAASVAIGAEVIGSAVAYGKALENLSTQLGVTVEDLQAYQKLARDTGVTQEQLSSAFGQFASNLGRAQQNEQEQVKVFKALGVNIKEFASAGDALPTVIDRISQIKDPAQRAAIETRLFGEEGRKLDSMLSGGAAAVSDLSRSLQETGQALSAKEIQQLDETARKLAVVKNQLQVDFARIVAGNANAIIGLARSFATLTGAILGTIMRLREFIAEKIVADKIGTEAYQGRARADLLATPTGRTLRAQGNLKRLDQVLFGDAGPQGTGSLDSQRGAMIRYLRTKPNAPATQEVERLLREQHEIRVAAGSGVSAPTPPVQTGIVNPVALRNLGTPSGPKGKSAEQREREAEERTKRFNDQLASAQADFLRAQEQMTGSADKRAEIEQQLLQSAYDARLADIESDKKRNVLAGADAKLEEARGAELKAAEKKAFDAQKASIEQDRRLDVERALTQKSEALLEVQAALLGSQIAVAKTAAERRRLELELLENQKAQERNRLEGVINASKPGDKDADEARVQLGSLDARYGAQATAVRAGTKGPLAEYLDSLPRTAEQVDEALQRAAANGLQSLNDGLTESVKKFLHLSGIAGDFLGQLIEIGIQRAVLIPLADKLFPTGGDGGSSGSGFLGMLGGLFGGSKGGSSSGNSLVADPKSDAELLKVLQNAGIFGGFGGLGGILGGIFGARAGGGNVVGGGSYLVGEHGPEIVTMGASGRVYPNGALPQIGAGRGGATIIAPQHFDLTGVVMTETMMRQFEARNRDYANAVAAQAGKAAVAASPSRLRKLDTLGS